MQYSPALLLHIAAGIAGVLAGCVALFSRKGSPVHKKAGNGFVIAMMWMAGSGAWIGFTRGQRINVIAGTFTLYLVTSAWLTVRRKPATIGRRERVLFLFGVTIAAMCAVFYAQSKGPFAAAYIVFGGIATLAIAGDARMLLRRGVTGSGRMVRHVWRMCFALFIATASFFLGRAGDPVLRKTGLRAQLFDPIRATHLPAVPVLIVIGMTIFWVCRVLFTDAYKDAGERRSAKAT
jgi:uncharacterized membrane protein